MEVNNTVFFGLQSVNQRKSDKSIPFTKVFCKVGPLLDSDAAIFYWFWEHLFYSDHVLMFWLVFTVTAFTWRAKRFAFASFLHLLLLHDFSGISGNSEKNILLTIEQLMKGSYKRKFFWSFFFWTSLGEGELPIDSFINVAIGSFAQH